MIMEMLIVLLSILHSASFEEDNRQEEIISSSQNDKYDKSQGKMLGFRVSRYNSIFPFTTSNDMMIPELAEGTEVTLRIVGHLANVREISLTSSSTHCNDIHPDTITRIEKKSHEEGSVVMFMPSLSSRRETVYFCLKSDSGPWKHQGGGYWAKLIVVRHFLSIPVILAGITTCLIIAAGLNASLLSLLSLNMTELKARADNGSYKEKRICRALIHLRGQDNLLIMAFIPGILFFKTIVTVLLNLVVRGWLMVLIGSFLIVLVCEVAPRLRKWSRQEGSMELQVESSIVSRQKEEEDADQ